MPNKDTVLLQSTPCPSPKPTLDSRTARYNNIYKAVDLGGRGKVNLCRKYEIIYITGYRRFVKSSGSVILCTSKSNEKKGDVVGYPNFSLLACEYSFLLNYEYIIKFSFL